MQQAEQIDTPAGAAASSGKSNGFSGSRRGLIGLALAAPIAAAMPGCGAPMPAATKAAMPRERTESEIRAV